MSHRVRVLCRPPVASGFRLAGLNPIEAADEQEGARGLSALLQDPEVGVLLVQEDLYAALPEALRRTLSGRAMPMVVPFPGPAWGAAEAEPDAFIAELLRRAIGYRVRLG